MKQIEIAQKIMDVLGSKSVTFYQLCRMVRMHPKTVRRCIELIVFAQQNEKLELKRDGFRIILTKERNSSMVTKM